MSEGAMSHDGPQRRSRKKKEICLVLINCHCSSIYMALQHCHSDTVSFWAFNLVCKHLAVSFRETFRRTAFLHAEDKRDTVKTVRYMAILRQEYEITIPSFEG